MRRIGASCRGGTGAVGRYDEFVAAREVRPGFNSILEFGNPAVVFSRVRLTSFRQPRRFVIDLGVFTPQAAHGCHSRVTAGLSTGINVLSFPKGSAQGHGARTLRNPFTLRMKALCATGVALHLLNKCQKTFLEGRWRAGDLPLIWRGASAAWVA